MLNTIQCCDCLEGMDLMPSNYIDCCVTSPPYFGLRDYGMEGQLGLEETPEEYVSKMVEVFREVKRVLKNDGTLWLNIGDSYANNKDGNTQGTSTSSLHYSNPREDLKELRDQSKFKRRVPPGLKAKDLIGVPWMLAFALRSDGWYLRQDIIWAKPNPMPESVTDRCTKSHEYIFLLSKSAKYYYDQESILQPLAVSVINDKRLYNPEYTTGRPERGYPGGASKGSGLLKRKSNFKAKNKRSVWSVTPKPFKEAHFAVFPKELIIDCIKAGCCENGIVLDPFMGSGTTAVVAEELNRNWVGFELNPQYVKIAEKRILDSRITAL